MKSFFSHTTFILLARIFLGGLFVASGLEKILDVQAFANSILQYKVVGQILAMCTATMLPSLELLCGLSLVVGLYPRGSELLMTVMLAGFTVLIASLNLPHVKSHRLSSIARTRYLVRMFFSRSECQQNRFPKNSRELRIDCFECVAALRSKSRYQSP